MNAEDRRIRSRTQHFGNMIGGHNFGGNPNQINRRNTVMNYNNYENGSSSPVIQKFDRKRISTLNDRNSYLLNYKRYFIFFI
jgi:hypothetical protein